jgi:hypothetical protein
MKGIVLAVSPSTLVPGDNLIRARRHAGQRRGVVSGTPAQGGRTFAGPR